MSLLLPIEGSDYLKILCCLIAIFLTDVEQQRGNTLKLKLKHLVTSENDFPQGSGKEYKVFISSSINPEDLLHMEKFPS